MRGNNRNRLVQRGGGACESEYRTAPAERARVRVLARVRLLARAQEWTWVECVGLQRQGVVDHPARAS